MLGAVSGKKKRVQRVKWVAESEVVLRKKNRTELAARPELASRWRFGRNKVIESRATLHFDRPNGFLSAGLHRLCLKGRRKSISNKGYWSAS